MDVGTLVYLLLKNVSSPWRFQDHGMAAIERGVQVRQQLIHLISATIQQDTKKNLDTYKNGTIRGTGWPPCLAVHIVLLLGKICHESQ